MRTTANLCSCSPATPPAISGIGRRKRKGGAESAADARRQRLRKARAAAAEGGAAGAAAAAASAAADAAAVDGLVGTRRDLLWHCTHMEKLLEVDSDM